MEPVLPEEVKENARIDYTDHDPELQHLITEARIWAEKNELRQALITQTVTEKFRRFESDMELRWSPVQVLDDSEAIAYIDADGDSQTLAATVYEIAEHLGIWVVRLKYGQIWPTTRDQEDAVTITYVVGYGDDRHDVPLPIRQAIKAYAVYRYYESVDEDLLKAARRLLGPYSAKR